MVRTIFLIAFTFILSGCLLQKKKEDLNIDFASGYKKKEFQEYLKNDLEEKTKVLKEMLVKLESAEFYLSFKKGDNEKTPVFGSYDEHFRNIIDKDVRIPFNGIYKNIVNLNGLKIDYEDKGKRFFINNSIDLTGPRFDKNILRTASELKIEGEYQDTPGERIIPYFYDVYLSGEKILEYKNDQYILNLSGFFNYLEELIQNEDYKAIFEKSKKYREDLPLRIINKFDEFFLDLSFIKVSDKEITKIEDSSLGYQKLIDEKLGTPMIKIFKINENGVDPLFIIDEKKIIKIKKVHQVNRFRQEKLGAEFVHDSYIYGDPEAETSRYYEEIMPLKGYFFVNCPGVYHDYLEKIPDDCYPAYFALKKIKYLGLKPNSIDRALNSINYIGTKI